MSHALEIQLSPRQRLILAHSAASNDAAVFSDDDAAMLQQGFANRNAEGLWILGSRLVEAALPPAWAWWRDLAARFVSAVCIMGDTAIDTPVEAPGSDVRQSLLWSLPPMTGAEYLDDELLLDLWDGLHAAFLAALKAHSGTGVRELLQSCHPSWHVLGRVHVHLAENRKDEHCPFAFLVTYTGSLSHKAKAKHLPLGQALKEYGHDRQRLITLLEPLSIAAKSCPWLQDLIDSQEIFHPLRWTSSEALRFLHDADSLRKAGVLLRFPAGWGNARPSRVQVSGAVGSERSSGLGANALLDFQAEFAIDGEPLSEEEAAELLAGSDGLQFIRGRWVEVDRERLQGIMAQFTEIQHLAENGQLGFHEAMRLLAGAQIDTASQNQDVADWAEIRAGPWLQATLDQLRQPKNHTAIPKGLRATLRPYQQDGLAWLHLLSRLHLGACLADDMGLGKTIQILALLLLERKESGTAPSLLIAPASLLANWQAEAERFAPDLCIRIAHSSAMPRQELLALRAKDLKNDDLVICSYASLQGLDWLQKVHWRHVILDEAQAIKNARTRQSRAARTLTCESRIILTGTPVENHLGDLWSLFDFINPGLLGTAKAFKAWTKSLRDAPEAYAPLRRLVQPYLLRRLKTDKTVIADLPDKVEQKVWCSLSRRQAALYQQAVDELERDLGTSDGIKRRGLILAYLLRFKQICNHPSQWLGDNDWNEKNSGKFTRLSELCDSIAQRQEKVLVFTQFRETCEPLRSHLNRCFGREGLLINGATPVKKRKDLVQRFQEDEQIPFFVISLKAGGSGLNLTAANHVIHFDRWWNPAVENQATDRAFRIGQHRNVLVHKFTCRGSIEERIDAMIEEKKALAEELFDQKGEMKLTEMDDDELLDLVRLDIHSFSED